MDGEKDGIIKRKAQAAPAWLSYVTRVDVSIDSKAREQTKHKSILYCLPDEAAGLSVFFTVLYICGSKPARAARGSN